MKKPPQWAAGEEAMELNVYADTAALAAAISELSLGLEALDSLEGFDQEVLGQLRGLVADGSVKSGRELVRLGDMAGQIVVRLHPGPLLERSIAALRAAQAH